MTVGELIEKLRELDPELPVYIPGYEAGINDLGAATAVQVYRNVHTEWYYGAHEAFDADDPGRWQVSATSGVVLFEATD